ncbi:MAG: hypothetical protein Q8R30_04015 [bacterium]|nr:hypothetical protein [bacterium]
MKPSLRGACRDEAIDLLINYLSAVMPSADRPSADNLQILAAAK